MKHIVLAGDSIFDNAGYVDKDDAVIDQTSAKLSGSDKASLIAVDGDITADVLTQLETLPTDTSHLFISAGGNDALRIINVLNQPTSTIGDAMSALSKIKNNFQTGYREMLLSAVQTQTKISVCTVHDSVPNFEQRAITALALFNEVILREAFSLGIPVLDLRLACNEAADYSTISPIEPSKYGAQKISDLIINVADNHPFDYQKSIIYS